MIKFSNNLRTSLSANIEAADTTISVVSVATFPTLVEGDTLYLTLSNPTSTIWEIVICTAISGTDLTVTRGAEGTTARDWTVEDNTKITGRVTAELLRNAIDEIISSSLDANFSSVQFTGGTGTQGQVTWNTDEETLDLVLNGVTLQLGQEVHYHARNNTASTIPNGTPVYATGTLGASGRITIAPYLADGTIPVRYFIGVTTEDIEAGADGKVTDFGKVRNVDTSTFTNGDVLYPSESTAGTFTNTKPTAPNLAIPCALVINAHSNGTLFIRVHPQDENAYATYAQGLLADSALQSGDNISELVNNSGYLTSYTETDPIVGAINGLVKADGNGTISAAVAGTDYEPADSTILKDADIGDTVQPILVSGTNIKTVGGVSLLGSGNLQVGAINDIFYENAQRVESDHTIETGRNAMTVGDIAIANNVTVTISNGSAWKII